MSSQEGKPALRGLTAWTSRPGHPESSQQVPLEAGLGGWFPASEHLVDQMACERAISGPWDTAQG